MKEHHELFTVDSRFIGDSQSYLLFCAHNCCLSGHKNGCKSLTEGTTKGSFKLNLPDL